MPTASQRSALALSTGGRIGSFASRTTLTAPVQDHGFQRTNSTTGTILIQGYYDGFNPGPLEANFNGGAYQTIAPFGVNGGRFRFTLTGQTPGTGTVNIRPVNAPSDIISVTRVRLGIVAIFSGQSNHGEQATNVQPITYAGGLSIFNGVFGLSKWGNGNNRNQAYWSKLGDLISTSQNCPLIVISDAVGGKTAEDWQPGTGTQYVQQDGTSGYYGNGMILIDRANYIYDSANTNGAELLFWWQGEANAITPTGITASQYQAYIEAIALNRFNKTGLVSIVNKIHQLKSPGATVVSNTLVNTGIAQAWANGSNKILQGMDLSDLLADADGFGDSVHFKSDANMQTLANRQWARIQAIKGWT